jgi:GTP-binding protein EngB required for normal cell division
MIENISNIKLKIEELSTLLGFFKQKSIKQILYKNIEETESTYQNIENSLENIQNEYKDFKLSNKTKIDDLTTAYENLKNTFSNLDIEFNNFQTTSKKDLENISLEKNYLELEKEKLEDEYKYLNNEYEKHKNEVLELRNIYNDLLLKDRLVSQLLASKSSENKLDKFKKYLYEDFYDFANAEETLANEAEAFMKLQAIEKELELITVYPTLYKKSIVAVGGGFSSGKSSFINSLINDKKVKLPEGINPTTAIPTYVMHKEENKFIACNHNGGVVDLSKLDNKFHEKLSHDFIKSFGFNLKNIMPFMIIGTDLKAYEHLCFIDTPGYNPASSSGSYSFEDRQTSQEFIETAQVLLWVVGLDANGIVSDSDLDFLSELILDNKKLFIVLNKADLKPKSDITNIVNNLIQTLEDYDIRYIGISAYNSKAKEEIYHINKSLDEFLNDINQSSSIQDSLVKKLYEVDEMYRKSIEENIKMKNSISEDLYSISFNLLKEGFDDFENPIYGRLNKLKEHYSTEIQENNLKRLDKEIEKLKNAIDEIFEINSKIKDVKSTQENIDLNNKIPIKYFPKNNVKNEIEKLNKRKTENKKKLRKFSKNDWLNWDYKTY